MSATITFEVECEVTGSIQPAEPDVGIMSAYPEDVAVESLKALVGKFKYGKMTWATFDLLAGLDKAARDTVLSNVYAAFSEDADDAVMQEGAE